jgi:hypothetical protein
MPVRAGIVSWATVAQELLGRLGALPAVGLFPIGADDRVHRKQKKPTWCNTRRRSATSAYSSTNPPAGPGCSSASHPTTIYYKAREARVQIETRPLESAFSFSFMATARFVLALPKMP